MPAAEASASTLDTAPPYPTATGDLGGGTGGAEAAGVAAPSVPMTAITIENDTFRLTE